MKTNHQLGLFALIKRSQRRRGSRRAVTLIQRFGSAAYLNTHLHCLVFYGVYHCGADWRAGVRPSRWAHRRRTARAAANCHRPADEDAHAPGRADRGDGSDLTG